MSEYDRLRARAGRSLETTRRAIRRAVDDGTGVREIERELIEPVRDAERQAALWLYLWLMLESPARQPAPDLSPYAG